MDRNGRTPDHGGRMQKRCSIEAWAVLFVTPLVLSPYSDTGFSPAASYAARNESGQRAVAQAMAWDSATWQERLESAFDIVDTFDHYDDWTGTAPGGSCASYPDGAPKYSLTGAPSELIRRHCYYGWDDSNGAARPVAIQDHGSNKRHTGKSLRLSHTGKGPLRGFGEMVGVKAFFGTLGDETSGYSALHLFFRMYLSKTAFPTYRWDNMDNTIACYEKDSGNWTIPCYVDGKNYVATDSWKWIAISGGFINEKDFTEEKRNSSGCNVYGINELHFHIKSSRFQNYEKRIILESRDTFVSGGGAVVGNVDISPFFDKLIGVEIYIKRETAAKAGDGEAIVWFYDENGNGTEVFRVENVNLFEDANGYGGSNAACWGKYDELSDPDVNNDPTMLITQSEVDTFKFNLVNFESNKRIYPWQMPDGPGAGGNEYQGGTIRDDQGNIIGDMETDWYMDDLIIDDQRIGPTYYAMLGGTNQPPRVTLGADTVSGDAPLDVTFTTQASDADGTIAQIDYDFDGDGTDDASVSYSQTPVSDIEIYSYDTPGDYTARVRVSDDEGAEAVDTVVISVSQADTASPPLLSEADGGGGCFLATAAYGTPVSEEVKGLAAFRDDHLLPNGFGRSVIDVYYRCGPEAARLVARREGLRAMVRFCLTPVLTGGREGR